MKPIPRATEEIIAQKLREGQSSRQIAEAVGIGKSSVARIRKALAPDTPLPRHGRKPKISPRETRFVLACLNKTDGTSAAQITRELMEIRSNPVSVDTVRRVLKKAGWKPEKSAKKKSEA